MKTLTLKEAQALYNILDESQVTESALVRDNDRPVRILVPADEYAAFLAWRKAEWERQQGPAFDEAFQREIAAFEHMKPELLKTHLGKAVGVYQGKIVAVGETKAQVYEQVIAKFGEAPIYIHVVEEYPRVY